MERTNCLSHLLVSGPLYDVNSKPNEIHGCADLPETPPELRMHYPAQGCSENSI